MGDYLGRVSSFGENRGIHLFLGALELDAVIKAAEALYAETS